MPIYEFRCSDCGERFEELVATSAPAPECPACGGIGERMLSPISPPGRIPRGAKVRDSESRRREREAARQERLAETKKLRARGELPPPRRSPGARGSGK
jgi:putative FmdB family regulatory protein